MGIGNVCVRTVCQRRRQCLSRQCVFLCSRCVRKKSPVFFLSCFFFNIYFGFKCVCGMHTCKCTCVTHTTTPTVLANFLMSDSMRLLTQYGVLEGVFQVCVGGSRLLPLISGEPPKVTQVHPSNNSSPVLLFFFYISNILFSIRKDTIKEENNKHDPDSFFFSFSPLRHNVSVTTKDFLSM